MVSSKHILQKSKRNLKVDLCLDKGWFKATYDGMRLPYHKEHLERERECMLLSSPIKFSPSFPLQPWATRGSFPSIDQEQKALEVV